MMGLTELMQCTGCRNPMLAQAWREKIEAAMVAYDITTKLRKAAFLARVGHESGGLLYTSELWGPTPAQTHYEERKGLGNTQPGDGRLFKGHGLIQVTGRANHRRMTARLRAKFPDMDVPDFEVHPELLAQFEWAAYSAADFWDDNNLNKWADAGDFDGVCDVINMGRKTSRLGDANGWAESLALYNKALEVLE